MPHGVASRRTHRRGVIGQKAKYGRKIGLGRRVRTKHGVRSTKVSGAGFLTKDIQDFVVVGGGIDAAEVGALSQKSRAPRKARGGVGLG